MRECAGEPGSSRGQSVHVRRTGVAVSIAAELRAEIFADDPDDVGPLRREAAYQRDRQEANVSQ
jgi:hypothetical protein